MREIEVENADILSTTEGNRNIRLTVVSRSENGYTYVIDLGLIWREIRRYFVLWLCFAVGLGALGAAVGLFVQRCRVTEDVVALISFTGGMNYDVRKIKSPTVVEAAMAERDMDLTILETVRNAIDIQGVISDSAMDKMSMYYSLISQSGSGGISAVQSLLDTDYEVSRYIVSFQYSSVELTREAGLDFMNALLRSYQDYFTANYNYNEAMGNALTAVDYREYDYAEAVNIFSTTLDNLDTYLSAVETSETAAFRSTETGFTFQDLQRTLSTIRDIDLDRVSSYITIHSVSTNDADTQIAYYEWRVENLTQQRAVQRTRMDSLTNSIANYEKDPILIAVQDGNSAAVEEDLNDNYDSMITQRLETQAAIASYNRSISYYESVIEGFRNASASSPEDIAVVEGYLADTSEKINALLGYAAQTVNEYYERMAFANRIQVLVPATGRVTSSHVAVKIAAAVEFIVMAVFGCIVFFKGIRTAGGENGHRKRTNLEP